ncbi:MAG TPA: AraC family ligand binding domain-containing protein, partial [Terrimicrobiaceae bacterium]|nr:AraC family ligand binding domain-containing protein [Terrimicrobiaceae bacterium]
MSTIIERILLSPGECFRLIRWRASNAKIEIISADGISVHAKGEGHHWHHHPETEITLFRSGAATRFVGDHIVRFSAPDLVLIGGNVPHYWHSDGLTSGVSVQCNFDDMNPVWSLPYFAGLPALRRLADRGVRISGHTGELVQQTMGNLENARGMERLSCFFQVLADLLAAPKADMQVLSTRTYSLRGMAGNVVGIRKALHLAFARFREEIHLEDVLKVNVMSKATFCRQFKKHMGQSYTDFLNHLRLQAACDDLGETDKPIIEV